MRGNLKTISLTVLLFALAFGCKKDTRSNEIIPEIYRNCRIVNSTYKTPTTGRNKNLLIDSEIIALPDGSQRQVSTVSKFTYIYDSEGRLIEEYEKLLLNNYFLTRFTYTSRVVIRYKEWTSSDSGKLATRSDTIPLNDQGLITRYYNDSYLVQYDLNGYPIKWGSGPTQGYYIYEHGNAVKSVQESFILRNNEYIKSGNVLSVRTDYALNRLNLPTIHSLIGKQSRNLPIRETKEVNGNWEFKNGIVYQKDYIYTFDEYGRVKRRIAYGKAINPNWLLEEDLYGIGVTDFRYECE